MQRAQTLRGWDGDRIVVPPVPETPRRPAGRKDTKRWCGGKVGREHEPVWVKSNMEIRPRPDNEAWWDERCARCAKKFRACWKGWSAHRVCKCGHHEG
jgi:hypothetical protein